METNTRPTWTLRPAGATDVETIAELRAVVMRPDLERLGRYDDQYVRQRLRDGFSAEHSSLVLVDDAVAGCVTLRPHRDGYWLENFLLSPAHQGHGIGSAVLGALLARTDAEGAPVRLDVLQGSAARRLYERHGFVVESEDPLDVLMIRTPGA